MFQLSDARDYTRYLREHIPLTGAMGIEVKSVNELELILTAPLKNNLNHRETAFGGSLSTLGITAGWALLSYCLHRDRRSHKLVIQSSNMDFLKPASTDLTAIARWQDYRDYSNFLKFWDRRGRSRIEVETFVYASEALVARHRGAYVALRHNPNREPSK